VLGLGLACVETIQLVWRRATRPRTCSCGTAALVWRGRPVRVLLLLLAFVRVEAGDPPADLCLQANPAADQQLLARDPSGIVGSQKQRSLGNVIHRAHAA
jgi:hypothetical protein